MYKKNFFSSNKLIEISKKAVILEKDEEFMLINDWRNNKTPKRTITIPYDLMGIIDYVVNQKLSLKDFYKLLNDPNTTFEGIDGKFSFKNNIISRELDILEISKGSANLIRRTQYE